MCVAYLANFGKTALRNKSKVASVHGLNHSVAYGQRMDDLYSYHAQILKLVIQGMHAQITSDPLCSLRNFPLMVRLFNSRP